MENINPNEMIDLGSEPAGEDFDPFADGDAIAETIPNQPPNTPVTPQPETPVTAAPTPTPPTAVSAEKPVKKPETKATETADFADRLPVFEYAGATENIDDVSKTFDELRIEKSADFPELEEGKRVSWTIEYGKVTKTVPDPKGTSIGKMKSDIETSKEFTDAIKKPRADKNPTCKVKPRVTAQSKGTVSAYSGVFTNMCELDAAGKVISVLPAKDGKVYEVRNTDMGKFITPVAGCELLSDVRAGFVPALPLIPMDLTMKIVSFFRHFTQNGADNEVLVNVYWDKQNGEYIADVPEQTVSKASVNSKISGEYDNERYIHYMDIHSHNSMKAFFSAVDDNDERATRLYTVVGRLDKFFPDIKTRISNGGKFLEIAPSEVFAYIGQPFPNEWKEKVSYAVCVG